MSNNDKSAQPVRGASSNAGAARAGWAPRVLAPLLAAMVMAGCAVGPIYERPAVDTPAAYKEAAVPVTSGKDAAGKDAAGKAGVQATDKTATGGDTSAATVGAALPADSRWKAAQPSDQYPRGRWWVVFGDDNLNALEDQAQAANQDLKAATARLAQARSLLRSADSARFPTVDAGVGPTRQQASADSLRLPQGASNPPLTLWRAQASVSYEVDLFGRVASTISAAGADAQQVQALLHSVQLAMQADVAQAYFRVREIDAEYDLYEATVTLRQQTLKLVERRLAEGDIDERDVARARSELAAARSESLGITRQRAIAEHALAILLGKAPADFSLPRQALAAVTLDIPAGLPSSLLERRPDIAAAERAMAAANARVGVAKAAFFPRLNLTGSLGFESSDLGDLAQWSSRTFLLGPLVGTALSLPIFDGGARKAGVERARAVYEEDVAAYRQTVLNAFREVEDNLANLRILGTQTQAQQEAVVASTRAARLSQIQYREGSVSFLEVIDADRTVLQQRRLAVQLDGERARSTVGLIRAMGGGWES